MATIQLSQLKSTDITEEPNLSVVTRLGTRFDLVKKYTGPGSVQYLALNSIEFPGTGRKAFFKIDDLRRDLETR